jgi:hypothetical protein
MPLVKSSSKTSDDVLRAASVWGPRRAWNALTWQELTGGLKPVAQLPREGERRLRRFYAKTRVHGQGFRERFAEASSEDQL